LAFEISYPAHLFLLTGSFEAALFVLNFSFKFFFRFEKVKPGKSMGSACLIIVFLLILCILSEVLQVLAALWFVFILSG